MAWLKLVSLVFTILEYFKKFSILRQERLRQNKEVEERVNESVEVSKEVDALTDTELLDDDGRRTD